MPGFLWSSELPSPFADGVRLAVSIDKLVPRMFASTAHCLPGVHSKCTDINVGCTTQGNNFDCPLSPEVNYIPDISCGIYRPPKWPPPSIIAQCAQCAQRCPATQSRLELGAIFRSGVPVTV